ncbi:hypothetical protein KUCAC02_022172 [Chaenocephalus aceratus]|nr:hypothetical protein KUCAC02_022172 [Chaenocephalus aceratus]
MRDASPAEVPGKMSDPEIVSPVSTPQADSATPTVPRAQGRRRFICPTCNFSTRTPQALANHAKTHTRKKAAALLAASPSSSLACGHCAFLTSSQTVMREHQKLVHPGQASVCGPQADKTRTSKPSLDSDLLSGSGLLDVSRGESQEVVSASEDSTMPNSSPSRMVLKRVGNRFRKRGKSWIKVLGDDTLVGSEEEQDEDQSTELGDESYRQDAKSLIGGTRHTRAQANTEDCSAQNASRPLPLKKCVKEEEDLEVEKDGKLLFLRRSHRGFSDEDSEALRSVERKCPYCPDRFHNGIGLANHVRGHLNRVGVSYNVRHFISPEEVNAIEKKFSYQKKKKKDYKVANFDPSTFSVMHCEFCSAGFDTRAGLSSHARAHLRDFGITNWDVTISPIHILRELFLSRPDLDLLNDARRRTGKKRAKGLSSGETRQRSLDSGSLSPGEDADSKVRSLKCEVCGSQFATRRGLSIHARSHLRRLGLSASESRGASVDILRQISKHVGGQKEISSLLEPLSAKNPSPSDPRDDEALGDMDSDEKPLPLSLLAKPPSPLCCRCLPPYGPPNARAGGMKGFTANLSNKPIWAPQENDAPLNLTLEVDPNKDIVCHLCGAWFETRKGLSSHARAHLRHFGVEYSESKGSPIDLLHRLIDTDDFKHKAGAMHLDDARGGATSKATSSLHGPPAKRNKSSSMRVFRLSSGELMALPHSEPLKEIGCEFCGEYFENRKGLSSHARSHLRQMGITEWSVNGSPIDTLRESKSSSTPPTSSSSGLILNLKPEPVQMEVTAPGSVGRTSGFSGDALNCSWSSSDSVFPLNLAMSHEVEPTRDIRCEFCGEYFENRKGLSSHARSHLRQMGITEWSVNGSPIDTLREVMHKRGGGTSSRSDQGVKKESTPGASSPLWDTIGSSEGLGVSGYQLSKYRKSPLSLLQSGGSRLHKQGLGSASATPPAGKFFRVSPLGKRPLSEEGQSVETTHSLKTFSPLTHDFSYKRKPSPDKHGHQDPSCELCGFYFENRKALASHARAHLRQFGVTEWCVNGSPIETLSAWIRSRPQKVLEMHRSYMQGTRTTLKKWSSSFAVSLVRPLTRDVSQGSSKTAEGESGLDLNSPFRPDRGSPSRLADFPLQAQVARSELNVRLPRGFERRPLKHPSCPEGTESPPKPPRTGTVPALVPKPPSYPLVKLVGKFYTLKCRFCEVEFHGPLSVQEDWIRHLQQHILKMNYTKPAVPKTPSSEPPTPVNDPQASTSSTSSTSSTPPTPTPTRTTAPNVRSQTPLATETLKVSEEQPTLSPARLPLPTQTV